jgi:phosphohistidine phosphatase SixA
MGSNDQLRLRLLVAFFAGITVAASTVTITQWWRDRRALDFGDDGAHAARRPGLSADKVAMQSMVQELRKGGYLLYFRHGNREKWDSVIAFDIHEVATGQDASRSTYRDAVCLSPQGREEALMIGQILRLAQVPVGHVVASPVCRARQTAQLAFGHVDGTEVALVHTPVVNQDNEVAFKEGLRKVLQEATLRPGTNTVISAHENTIVNHPDLFASGSRWLQMGMVQEGGMYVIRRDADQELHVVHRFSGLGDLAAAGITLKLPSNPVLNK